MLFFLEMYGGQGLKEDIVPGLHPVNLFNLVYVHG